MAVATADAQERSPIEEKSSYDQHDSKSSDVDVHAQSLSFKEAGVSGKPKLPYRWQFAIIILTCLCTCKYIALHLTTIADSLKLTVGNHWSNVSINYFSLMFSV